MNKPGTAEKVILGIDPGTSAMGYAIILCQPRNIQVIEAGALNLNNKQDHFIRIKNIFEFTVEIITKFLPDELAIEAPFYGKNIQSMLKLGRAQGAAISAALSKSLPITEYAPRKVKLSITGRGNASKESVANYLKSILKNDKLPQQHDATDALAVALCHHYQTSSIINTTQKHTNWNDFIKKNPGRVK